MKFFCYLAGSIVVFAMAGCTVEEKPADTTVVPANPPNVNVTPAPDVKIENKAPDVKVTPPPSGGGG